MFYNKIIFYEANIIMKNPLNFFKSLFFWSVLGIICLLLLVWFIGPEIAISGIKPLASEKNRIIVCIGICLMWFGKIIVRHWREARRNALLLKEIKASQEPILKKSVDESAMARQFAEIDGVLKNAKFAKTKFGWLDSGQYLYQMPWYVVLGAAGSGKTTALKQSGLNFPLESTLGSSINGLAGTKDCDWFLTDEAVLLDTAGRLSLHDKQYGQKDVKDWEEFTALLKRYRPKQPINGLIVTVGVDDLLGNEADLLDLASELKKRIQEMRKQFGIEFPVYLTITKLDLLCGFNSFFSHLNEEERKAYFGVPVNHNDMGNDSIELTQHALAQILAKFRSFSLTIASNLNTSDERAGAFVFPEEFERLNQSLFKFLKELSKHSKFEEAVQWRGIYFTSAVQNGMAMALSEQTLYKNLQLTKKYSENERTQSISGSKHQGYFLNKLFSEIIFSESSLAGENKSWFIKDKTIYWLGVATILVMAAIALVWMLISYFNNKAYLNEVKQKAATLSIEIQKSQEIDFRNAIGFANKIQELVKTQDISDLNHPSIAYRMGLYQGSQMKEVGISVYNRILHDSAMPLISQNVDTLLRNDQGNNRVFTYNALKAYLMMFDKEHFDKDFMQQWLSHNFFNQEQLNQDINQVAAHQALQQVLAQENLIFSVPYDAELVESKRQELAKTDVASLILEQTLQEVVHSKANLQPVSFSSMGGAQSHLLFRRKSGVALKEPIHAAYTKEAYIKVILPSLVKNTAILFKESAWVLDAYGSDSNTNETMVLQEVQQQYYQRYIKTWTDYIVDLTLVSPKSTRENVQIAKLLSDKNSPLVSIIRGISENTTLDISKQLQATESNTVKEWLVKAQVDVEKMVGALSNQENSQMKAFMQSTPVDEAFTSFHALVKSEKEQPATINGVIDAINELYVYLIAVNVSVEKGVDLPPDDPFVKYKAEVGRLPSPFREMLENFATVILERTDKVVDERLMSSLTKQLAPVTQQCEAMMAQGYPFQKTSVHDVAIEHFSRIFGSNGGYQKFKQLDNQVASLAKVESLDALMAKNETFANRFSSLQDIQFIQQAYFNKGIETPKFDFTIKVMLLDPKFESIRIVYDGKDQLYSHGPVVPLALSWPTQSENPQMKLEMVSSDGNTTSINTSGVWAVFKLIEKGQIIRQTGNSTVVSYTINDKKIVLEFNAQAQKNPFDLNWLRNFKCIH